MSSIAIEGAAVTVQSPSSAPPSPPALIDIQALLSPIPGDNPVGENLQYSTVHDEIREARRAEDTLPQGDWEHKTKAAQWTIVIELSTAALANRTKDLQISAWLSEALVHLYGFVGLRDGLKVIRGLHERYWDHVYPVIEDNDLDARANILSLLDKLLEFPLKSLPLTKSGSGFEYSYFQWEESTKFDFPENMESLEAEAYDRLTQLKMQAEAEKKTTGEVWRKAKGLSPRVFYEQTYGIVIECWQEFEALDKVMDEKFGRQTPGLGTLKKSLDSIRTLVEKLVKEKRFLEPDPPSDGTAQVISEGTVMSEMTGPVRSREEALKRLAEVAHYFQTNEPHSPVAYLVQRAIKWGQMPLELWLEDVIKDGSVLGQLKETLGLKTPFQQEGGS
ncbi:MAG TPA: type VI secretion system protein TssA [Pyrinomonadaceae bacterium]|nr:type VI secretion system protein TssA [Pyrinomonadaceae bacterium]